MANGIWANGLLAQAKLCDAKFGKRKPREEALNAVTNHYRCKDGRWLIVSLLNEDKQFPTFARCICREDLIADERFLTTAHRHARSVELIRILDEVFATKDLAEWRSILDGNGLVFGVVGILDDLPHDRQMIENEVLVPFENDTMMTISSPIWVDGARKVRPRKPPGIGEHSDEILRNAGFDEAAIKKLRASGTVATVWNPRCAMSPIGLKGLWSTRSRKTTGLLAIWYSSSRLRPSLTRTSETANMSA